MSNEDEDEGEKQLGSERTEERSQNDGMDIISRLKKQKRVNKMQATKLYTRLARLMSSEETDREAILEGLEALETKNFEILEIIDELVGKYRERGDERNAIKFEEELDSVANDAERDSASVKAFISTMITKPITSEESSDSFATMRRKQQQSPPRIHKDNISETLDQKRNVYELRCGRTYLGDTEPEEKAFGLRDLKQQRRKIDEKYQPDNIKITRDFRFEPSYGLDRRMPNIQIPKFKGDKTKFESFWAAFSAVVDESDEPPKYKMIRLKACLEGKAEEAISRLGFTLASYEEAKRTLERKFGGERRQNQNHLDQLRNMAPLQERNIGELEKFTDNLVHTVVLLREKHRWSELEPHSMLYTLLMEKISKPMLANYFRWVNETRRKETLENLRDWMVEETEYRMRASELKDGLSEKETKRDATERRVHRNYASISKNSSNRVESLRDCVCCKKPGHRVWNCEKFTREWNVAQRWKLAKDQQLCFRCLAGSHQGKDCLRSRECGIDSCQSTHHKLLHAVVTTKPDKQDNKTPPDEPTRSFAVLPDEEEVQVDDSKSSDISQKKTYIINTASAKVPVELFSFRTIPVWLEANGRKLKVNAVLDDASSASYLNEEVAGFLGLSVPHQKIAVQVLNNRVETFDSMPVELTLESTDGNLKIPFSVNTCPRQLTGTYKVVDWKRQQDQWPHLKVCNFPDIPKDPLVDVLIGQDHIDLHYSRCDVKGQPGEPIARLGPLGWSCIGCSGKKVSSDGRTNFAYTFLSRPQGLEQINESLRRFWEIDSTGAEPKCNAVMTNDEKEALEKVRQSFVKVGHRYQVAVPWVQERPVLPDNYEMAVGRLKNTEKRLMRHKETAEVYKATIDAYEKKGYIRKVEKSEKTPVGGVWYLPHFPICRPDKSTTKTRIVFDASAKVNGISLNDQIHSGPNLQKSLFDILMRFRRHRVALVCDIREMYLQICIPVEDRPFFRLLWRDLQTYREPEVYEFERMVFGDASAPFRAQFVAQENAKNHHEEFPRASETVRESTYMDDSLDSEPTDEAAIELYHQLTRLWAEAGMEARKWLSNSTAVIQAIPEDLRAAEIDLAHKSLPSTKALGVLWMASKDVFSFRVASQSPIRSLAKRTILSKVATIFDPLGFIAPFIVRAKILLQDLWSQGLDWDEPVDASSHESFGMVERSRRN